MTDQFFSYDGQNFETHNTEQEARDAAEDALEFFRGEASDGWDDESMHVCWGRLMQSVQVTKERPAEPDDNMPEGIETYQRRELVDVNPETDFERVEQARILSEIERM